MSALPPRVVGCVYFLALHENTATPAQRRGVLERSGSGGRGRGARTMPAMSKKKAEEKPEPDDLPKSEVFADADAAAELERLNRFEREGGVAYDPVVAAAGEAAYPQRSTEPKPAPQPPSLGRIVIYTSTGEKGYVGEQHAALITAIENDGSASLRVFTRTAEFVSLSVRFTDNAPGSVEAQGRWAWPPRV